MKALSTELNDMRTWEKGESLGAATRRTVD
jgi:hypothetical protein